MKVNVKKDIVKEEIKTSVKDKKKKTLAELEALVRIICEKLGIK